MTVVAMKPNLSASFEEFWKLYPRKIGKPIARAKWDKITNGGLYTRTLDRDSGTYVEISLRASVEEILEGVRRYREAQFEGFKLKDGGRFICHPATWLNQGRWMDG